MQACCFTAPLGMRYSPQTDPVTDPSILSVTTAAKVLMSHLDFSAVSSLYECVIKL